MLRYAAVVAALASVTASRSPAQSHALAPATDSSERRVVGPGVALRLLRSAGPVVLHVLEIDLRRSDLIVRAVRACDRLSGRERPTAIARRLRAEGIDVVAMLNAGFFDLQGGTGESESNLVLDGDLAKGMHATESPFDRIDNVHSQFAVTRNGRPLIERFTLSGTVRSTRGRWPLAALNAAPVTDAAALYTSWAERPPRYSRHARSASVPLVRVGGHGDTTHYRVRAAADRAGDSTSAIALLVGTGRSADGIARLRAGELVTIVASLRPDRGPLQTLVGGWPRILRDGIDVAVVADSLEGTAPRFSTARHPRSIVGISRDSATLYLVAVDGRQRSSIGMSLPEAAQAMRSLGAHDALNLDGGGSTALLVGDSLVNVPSDSTGERPVGDVLVITREPGGWGGARPRDVPARAPPASCVLPAPRGPER